MSDSIIAILGMGFLLGITVTLVIIGAIYGSDNQGQLHNDSDVRLYIPVRDRCRRGDNGRDKPLEQEEVRKVLIENGFTVKVFQTDDTIAETIVEFWKADEGWQE